MKNPYYYKRGKVHPSPQPPPLPDHFLSLLPAAILSLTAALSPDDRQVLAYLVSCCPNAAPRRRDDHVPGFGCACFKCYMSYWVRWDASPNRQLIHEIIEAYEGDQLLDNNKNNGKGKKKKKKKRGKNSGPGDSGEGAVVVPVTSSGFGPVEEEEDGDDGGLDQLVAGGVPDEENKGNVRKVVGLLGEKIWGFWN